MIDIDRDNYKDLKELNNERHWHQQQTNRIIVNEK